MLSGSTEGLLQPDIRKAWRQMDMEGLSKPAVYDKPDWYGQRGNPYAADFPKGEVFYYE